MRVLYLLRKGKGLIRKGNPPMTWKVVIMTKFNFTAEELNAMLGWGKDETKRHSCRWNRLRNKFADMDEDQFNEVYRAFYEGSTGIIHNATKQVTDKEAEITNFILTMIARAEFPISFSDAYFSNKLAKVVRGYDLRDRTQKIIDTLEKNGAVEGLRVIKIMTQGTCHIKLYEIR